MPHHEHITIAELHLFTLVRRAQRQHSGLDCKVTVYKIHEGVVWTKEVGKEGRRRDKEEVVEMKALNKLLSIMDNQEHPLHHLVDRQRSTFSNRLVQLRCRKDRYRKSFLPTAIRLYNSHL